MKPEFNFILLLHLSRSGSTYLARHLTENCSDLAVISETNYFRTLLAHQKIHKKYQPKKLALLITEDPKFKSFQFSEKEILKMLQTCGNHKEAIIFITEMILYKLGIKGVANIVIKDGGLVDFIPEVTALFPNIKIIHIKRDPRGCINSMLHTPKSFNRGKSSMGWDDIALCVTQYQVFMAKINKIEGEGIPLLTVIYKDLVTDKEAVIKNAISYLELQPCAEDKNRSKNFLRKQELIIHKNIYNPEKKERVSAWKHELKRWEIIYIESRLKAFILKPTIKKNSFNLMYSVLRAGINHIAGMFKLTVYRIKRYLLTGNLSKFFLKLKLRLARND
ncbi:MAG: sulfotransferase [bacterium]|nr:sulfotransferase [bacterium]